MVDSGKPLIRQHQTVKCASAFIPESSSVFKIKFTRTFLNDLIYNQSDIFPKLLINTLPLMKFLKNSPNRRNCRNKSTPLYQSTPIQLLTLHCRGRSRSMNESSPEDFFIHHRQTRWIIICGRKPSFGACVGCLCRSTGGKVDRENSVLRVKGGKCDSVDGGEKCAIFCSRSTTTIPS